MVDEVSVQPGEETATITGLTNGKSYTFRVTTIDTADNESAGVEVQATPLSVDLTTGLSGAWDFEDVTGNTVPDVSGNNKVGVLSGHATTTDTVMGKSLSLDGTRSTFMDTPLNVNTASQDMTVSMWFKVDESVFGEGVAPALNLVLLQQLGNGRSLIQILPNKHLGINTTGTKVDSVSPINTEGWQHVTLSTNSSTKMATIYIDGVQDSVFTVSGFTSEASAGFRVGQHKGADQLPFNGLVDQIKIYNRVLSDAEVQALFNYEISAEVAKDRFVAALNEAKTGYGAAENMRQYVEAKNFPDQLCNELQDLIAAAESIDLETTDISEILVETAGLIAKTRELDAAIKLLNIVSIDIDNVINRVNKELYGVNHRYAENGFGMWDTENQRVFPKFDMLYREVGFGSMRYPGGTIANMLEWKRSIGPVNDRKLTIHGNVGQDPIEPNFGLDEAARYAEETGTTLVYMYGIGNGNATDAADLVEYLNVPVGTNPNGGIAWAEVRAANGHPEPYNVFNFEIGNEVYLSNQRYWTDGSGAGNYQSRYANGGEVSFTKQDVVMDEDWRPAAALSDGTPNQEKYIRYVPLKAGTVHVFVGDQEWTFVDSFAGQGPTNNVYTLDYETGKITFGDGNNGNIPDAGARITASYTSIKDGFKACVTAMKAVEPRVKVYSCLHDDPFFNAMGGFEYDGVVIHAYGENNGKTNVQEYHDNIMTSAENQVNVVANMINKVKAIDSRLNVIVTEYSILGLSAQFRPYLNSTGRALYTAKALMGFAKLEIPYANKQSLIDTVGTRDTVSVGEMGVIQYYVDENNEFVDFVSSPVTLPMEMFSKYFGQNILATAIANNPAMNGNPAVAKLDVLASKDDNGNVYLMVANTDRLDDVSAVISFADLEVNNVAQVITMVSPEFNSQNTPDSPHNVRLVGSSIGELAGKTEFAYTFPKHSVVSIMLTPKNGDVDKTTLNAKIAEIRLLHESDYTEESWTALQTAVQAATTVSENPTATQQEVDTVLTNLESAMTGLVEKEPPVEVRVTDVTLEPSQVSMYVGTTRTLTATVLPENVTNKSVTWTTSNNSIATVADGVVTAKAVGTAAITVTTVDGSKTAQCTVNVTRQNDGGSGGGSDSSTTIEAGNVINDATLNQALQQAADDKDKVTLTAAPGATAIGLTAAQVSRLQQAGKPVEVKLPGAELLLPLEVLQDAAGLNTGAAQVELKVEKVDSSTTGSLAAAAGNAGLFQLAGEMWEITLTTIAGDGSRQAVTSFSKPVQITLAVPAAKRSAATAGRLAVSRYNETSRVWEPLSTIYDEKENKVVAVTSRFSKYALVEKVNAIFSDITGHWAQVDIELMAMRGVVHGIASDQFAPEALVTRAEFAAMLVNALEVNESSIIPFKDVQPGAWYYESIVRAYDVGLVKGVNIDEYAPVAPITRQEMAVMMVRALASTSRAVEVSEQEAGEILARYSDRKEIAPWATGDMAASVKAGVISGRNANFVAPVANATRAEAVVMLKRMLQYSL